jgi:glycosyltransferase involved in cell wall biosynthesis
VAARIRKYYGRRAKVIFPPVAVSWLDSSKAKRPEGVIETESAYLFAGALVPYKGAELAIEACTQLDRDLWVAGTGPELDKLKNMAGPKVKFLGKVSDSELAYLLGNCKALLFPCKEDFGILPLEAQAAGKPVIALFAGACKQTIKACKHWLLTEQKLELASQSYTGVFIRLSSKGLQCQALVSALLFFEANEIAFSTEACRLQAKKYSAESFYNSWSTFALSCPELCNVPMSAKDEFVYRFEALRLEEFDSC